MAAIFSALVDFANTTCQGNTLIYTLAGLIPIKCKVNVKVSVYKPTMENIT